MSTTTRRRVAGGLGIVALLGSMMSPASAAALGPTPDEVIIQAHRGGPALGGAENSVALFHKAVESGLVDRIETDVRSTRDDVLVIIHDAKLRSTCSLPNGTSVSGRLVRGMLWSELKQVSCSGAPIPRLTDALEAVRGSDVSLNLELKLDEDMSTAQKTDVAKRVVTTVLQAGMQKQVGISSYYWRSYAGAVEKYGKGIPMTAMEFPARTGPTDAPYATIRRAEDAGVDAFAMAAVHANEALTGFINSYGGMRLGTQDRTTEQQSRYALARGSWTFTDDDPVAKRRQVDELLARVDADPLRKSVRLTSVPTKTLVSKKVMKSGTKTFPRVFGGAGLLPAAALAQLDSVVFTVTVAGKGAGKVELAPSGSRPSVDGDREWLPNGTKTFTMYASPGDSGNLRVMTTGTATVTVKMTGYRTATY
jgi:glycerophosphoryl diester phosphodiesterase